MELFTNIINEANYVLWTYVLIIMLLGCAIWFSVKTRFVQFRMLGEMIRLLGDSTAKINGREKHISSFAGKPCWNRQSGWCGNGPYGRWTRSDFLDVDYCAAGFQQCLCRIYVSPAF